ncbi:patatin-like phospholipase family protein [Bowmanella sp. Y26]|uniref:patatin-like phospholipase family protein n=1 Tax=Bowmanella yangjiangensis TaxID=2811230 RepID=UPI001BDC5EF7|nr:patatin-like phospholipase family protein [Bowmanella yangjiangensis]MBT1065522.1 patatin-like phospholipase family protein [Bowmanella yangjiangensis]
MLRSFFILVLSLVILPLRAESPLPCEKVEGRPCIALVLGGGGARGGAHLGVIRELEARQIPVDLVVGTSIGAFVGGLYASGKSPDEIADILHDLNWGDGFRDQVYRDEMPMRRKQQRDEYPIRLELGVGLEGVRVPKGVLAGQAMADLVEQAFGVQSDWVHFDRMPIPFRAVATDLTNSDEVVLEKGSLLAAVQASMSIPGVVRPMKLDGKLLVDGGVANNLPVSIAKALGADRVIAVNIDGPLKSAEQLDSAFAITEQLTSFLVRQGVLKQLALLQETDLHLRPQIDDIGTLDFFRLEEAVAAGRLIANQHAEQLLDFSQDADSYQYWLSSHRNALVSEMAINRLILDNQSRLDDDVLIERLGYQDGKALDSKQLREGIRSMYGLDTLERVSYQLYHTDEKETTMVLKAEEKSWGPGYLNFRFRLEDDFGSNRHVQLGASYTLTNLSKLGAEWHSELALGTDKLLSSELYWPVLSPATFVTGKMVRESGALVVEDSRGLSLGDFYKEQLMLSVDAGWNISDDAVLKAGWIDKNGSYRLPAALASSFGYKHLHYDRRGPQFAFAWDTLDNSAFPTRGIKLSAVYQWLDDRFADEHSDSVNQSWELVGAHQWRSHLLKTRWRFEQYESDDGDIALEQYSLGGLFNLSGYPKNYLFGPKVAFGSLIYMYKLHEDKFGFFKSPLYLGMSVERGRVEDNWLQPDINRTAPWIWAGSIFAGWDSPIGPVFLGYGQAEAEYQDSAYQLYLSLGQTY